MASLPVVAAPKLAPPLAPVAVQSLAAVGPRGSVAVAAASCYYLPLSVVLPRESMAVAAAASCCRQSLAAVGPRGSVAAAAASCCSPFLAAVGPGGSVVAVAAAAVAGSCFCQRLAVSVGCCLALAPWAAVTPVPATNYCHCSCSHCHDLDPMCTWAHIGPEWTGAALMAVAGALKAALVVAVAAARLHLLPAALVAGMLDMAAL